MARVTDSDLGRTFTAPDEIRSFLAEYGIWYRRFEGGDTLGEGPTDQAILDAYEAPMKEFKEAGFVHADVINVEPDTPGLGEMLAKFAAEHWHDEDEIRFIVGGRGIFHIHPIYGPVFSIEVVEGDMINVPEKVLHWFNLCEDKAIRAIRLFRDPSGWVPHYTDSGVDAKYQPLCLGPTHIPPAV